MNSTKNFPIAAGACITLLMSALSSPTRAEMRSVEDRAFACNIASNCIYFDELRKKSTPFRSGLQNAIKKSGVKVEKDVYGVVSPMVPVVIAGRPALIGNTCEPHNCPHELKAIFYRSPTRVVAQYIDPKERPHPIGQLSTSETMALKKMGGYSVGEVFGPP